MVFLVARKLKPEEFSEARKEAMQELELKNKPLEVPKETEIVKIEKPKEKEIIKTEPDKKLIADIVKLYAKYYERARVETMMYYWELGKRLNKEYGSPQHGHGNARAKKGTKGFISVDDSRKQFLFLCLTPILTSYISKEWNLECKTSTTK